MPYKILTTKDGRSKYYLTEMDYHPTEEEIYADGWRPPVHVSNIYEQYEPPPCGPHDKPMSDDLRRMFREAGCLDEHDRVTEQGREWLALTQAQVDGTETEADIYREQAIQAECFRIASGHYFQGDRRFRLYRMYGIDTPPMAQGFADVGFVRKDTVAMAGRRGPIVIRKPERTLTLEIPDAEYLYRLSYDPQRPNRLLVSGQFRGGEIFSWSYAPGTGELFSVTDNGVPAYKCALWDGACYYAERLERLIDISSRLIVEVETNGNQASNASKVECTWTTPSRLSANLDVPPAL